MSMPLPRSLLSLVFGLLMMWALPAQASTTTAAVMPLGKGAGPAKYDGLGRALADMMVTDLSTFDSLQLVERAQLSLVLDELKLAKSGFLDKRTAQKLGKGLGAELVITGTYSVVDKAFIMDIRIVVVASGAILKAARSDGSVDDFIAIEKDVVEKLLSGLDVKLTPGARRKMLLAAPTESATALASYGRGLELSEAGLVKQAKAAFEEAVKQDPDFAKANLALRDMATMAESAGKSERERYQDNVQRSLEMGLQAIPSEMTRSQSFKDTRDSLMDFTIRQYLLQRAHQHCTRYNELKHFLLRKKGEFEGWFIGMKPTYQESWQAGEKRITERAIQLGIAGPEALFDSNARGLMFEASPDLTSGNSLLLSHSMSPEVFDTVLRSMEQCHTPNVQIAEFNSLMKQIGKWKWLDKPLSTTVGEGPSTMTPRDSLDLYWAYLRALHRGVDAKVRARSDAVLARHPEGDAGRRQIISRVNAIVSAGESYERSLAARMNRSDATILRHAKAALAQDDSQLHSKEAICQVALTQSKHSVEHSLEEQSKLSPNTTPERRRNNMDRLASATAPLLLARCFRQGKAKTMDAKEILTTIAVGIKRPHPATLSDKRCLDQGQRLRKSWAEAQTNLQDAILVSMLNQLHSLRTQRCLLP